MAALHAWAQKRLGLQLDEPLERRGGRIPVGGVLPHLANARGDTQTAEDSYMAAARFGGDLELDPATTSPTVIEGYRTAHELLANSPTGGLTIVTEPKGGLVSVDGQRVEASGQGFWY